MLGKGPFYSVLELSLKFSPEPEIAEPTASREVTFQKKNCRENGREGADLYNMGKARGKYLATIGTPVRNTHGKLKTFSVSTRINNPRQLLAAAFTISSLDYCQR